MADKCHNLGVVVFYILTTLFMTGCQSPLVLLNNKEKPSKTKLMFFKPDSANDEMFIVDSKSKAGNYTNLVVVTHGWLEIDDWPLDLAKAMKSAVDQDKWICGWYDWRNNSIALDPADTAVKSKEVIGPILGKKILRFAPNLKHIHLIGHSSGAWCITEAAKYIAEKTDASIHLTFLDAFVPLFWNEKEIGDLSAYPNTVYWSDHYFTFDPTLVFTEVTLSNAYNVDVTEVNPNLMDHYFPRHWYEGSITGRFNPNERYGKDKVYYHANGLKFGFARSLEAGIDNWQKSLTLKPGNKPVKIKKSE